MADLPETMNDSCTLVISQYFLKPQEEQLLMFLGGWSCFQAIDDLTIISMLSIFSFLYINEGLVIINV